MFVLFFFSISTSSSQPNYTSPWQWTKVTATGEWHMADARKDAAPNLPTSELSTYHPGNNDFHNFQQLMGNQNVAGNNNVTKNRMQNLNMPNGGNNSSGLTSSNNGKSFQMPYPFLPPPQSQAMSAQNPMSPTNSSILPSTPMANQSSMATVQQQQHHYQQQQQQQHQQQSMAATRPFSMDRLAGINLESNNNQTSKQSNSADQSSVEQHQQQHNPMLSPTRHLPFPYSNLSNFHRNF